MTKRWLGAVFIVLGLSSNAFSMQYTFTTIDYPENPFLKVDNTWAGGINDKGQIVGTFEGVAGLDQYPIRSGFLYSDNQFKRIDGYGETSLGDINNNGAVAGAYSSGSVTEGIRLGFSVAPTEDGSYTKPIPYLPPFERARGSSLGGINDAGYVAGSYEIDEENTSGFIFNGNSFEQIYEGWETFVRDVNNRNQVVGTYWVNDLKPVGFLWDGADSVNTISYPGAWATETMALNDKGAIVGSYNLFDPEFVTGPSQGFLYDGEYHAINFPGADSTVISGINNLGYLVGSYSDGEISHGFLAAPRSIAVPEPSSMILFGLAIGGIFAAHRFSRGNTGSQLA